MPDKTIYKEKPVVVTGVWSGSYSKKNLPTTLYKKTGKKFAKAVKNGYELQVKFGTKDYEMMQALMNNTWYFSAAKVYQQVRGMEALKAQVMKASRALLNPDGDEISTYKAFKEGYYDENGDQIQEGANDIFDTYNDVWLNAEYNTALNSSRMASRWNQIQKAIDILPYLQYTAVEDGSTCEICNELDGICRRADDPFWDDNYPPQHFNNCRCTVAQLDAGEGVDAESDEDEAYEAADRADEAGRTDMFKMNVGKDKIVFKTDGDGKHPYFSVAKSDERLLNTNFGLPKIR